MDLGVNRLLGFADKAAPWAAGGYSALYLYNAGRWQTDIYNLANGTLHAPNIQEIMADWNFRGWTTGLIAAIGAYVASKSGFKYVDEIGSILFKALVAYYGVSVAESIFFSMTHGTPASIGLVPGQLNVTPPQIGLYTVSPLQGSTLGSAPGGQASAAYQSVYPTNPTAGGFYTAASGARGIGN